MIEFPSIIQKLKDTFGNEWEKYGEQIKFSERNRLLDKYISSNNMKKLLSLIVTGLLFFTNLQASPPQLLEQASAAIDRELDSQYLAKKIKGNPIINDDAFVRRAYLAIAGRNPTYDEYQKFTSVTALNKRTELVRYLVNIPAYNSSMYNFWAEQLRLRERINNVNFMNGTLYISWIKDQISKNVPYNQFVRNILTASGDYYNNPAVGYLERDLGMPLDNMIATFKVFGGIDITCAQCHDDPFQDWTQIEFYKMAAMFNTQPVVTGRRNPEAREKIKQLRAEIDEQVKSDEKKRGLNNQVSNFLNATLAGVEIDSTKTLKLPNDYRYKDAAPNSVVSPGVLIGKWDIKHPEDLRIDAVEWLVNPNHPSFTKNIVNKYWEWVFGKPIVPSTDNLYGENLNDPLLNLCANIFQKINYNQKEFIQILCSTKLFQRGTIVEIPKDNFVFTGPIMKRLTAEQIWDSILSIVLEKPEYFSSSYPEKYRSVMSVPDFATLDLNGVLNRLEEFNKLNREKYAGAVTYGGLNLIRASEINDTSGNNTILAGLGRSDRELLNTNTVEGSVTQVISLMNGQLVDVANKKDSYLSTLTKGKSESERIEIIFKTILSRKPTIAEKSAFKDCADADVIWALVNTNEFKFLL